MKKNIRTGLIHEELEPRLLFSAGLETVLIDDNMPGTEPAIVETVSESETESLQLEQSQQTDSASAPAREVVFIDENVDNYDQLLADLATRANTDVFILDTSVDAVDQISTVLADYQGLDAIHLVSHGNEAGLMIGNGTLDNSNIDSYRDAISGWQAALSDEADLLIYGCDVAASAEGQAFISNLQSLTGTDVAASDDLTGHASAGADWDLEYQAGEIETSIVFSTEIQSNWVGVLPASVSINNLAGDTLAYSEGDGAQTIEQGSNISTSLSGGGSPSYNTLTVSITAGGDTSEDILSIRNQGNGSNQIGFDGTDVYYEGTMIGAVSGGSNGTDLVITFDSTANSDSVADLIENITYENTDNDNPTVTPRTIDFTLSSSGGGGGGGSSTTTESTSVDVSAVNDAPVAAGNTVTTNEDTAYTFSAADFNFSDVDGDSLASIKITSLESAGALQLNGVDVALNEVISKADIDAGKLSFSPAANANGAGHDSFAFSVNDGTTNSAASYAMSLDVTAVNDAPVNNIPAEQFITEDSTLIFSSANGNAISINDVDASGGTMKVLLSVGKGTLTLGSTSGLSFQSGDGVDDRSLSFEGSVADINNALEGMTYTTDAHANGDAVLTIVTDDKGNHGSGGTRTDTDNININIEAVNNAPTNTIPGEQAINQGETLQFSSANGNGISIRDIDDNGNAVKVTLSVDNGHLSLANTVGLSFETGDGSNDPMLVVSGSIADINAALDGLSYMPDADYAGPAVLSIVTDDQGNSGTGGAKTDTDQVDIQIAAAAVTDTTVTTPEAETPATMPDSHAIENIPYSDPPVTVTAVDNTTSNVEADVPPETATTEETAVESDIVISIDAEGKPSIQVAQGRSELMHALINMPVNSGMDNINLATPINMASQQNVNIASVSPWNLASGLASNELQMALDELNQQLGSDGRAEQSGEQLVVTTVTGVSIALTVGFVSWALQGGSLLTALMTVLPVWNTFDPLPVLNANANKKTVVTQKQDDELDAVFANSKPTNQG